MSAMEFSLCELFAILYKLTGWTDAEVDERLKSWSALARSSPIEGLSAADAALISGEMEDALSELSRLIKSHLGESLQQNPRNQPS
jgi:hypothetical protein